MPLNHPRRLVALCLVFFGVAIFAMFGLLLLGGALATGLPG